MNNKLYYVFAGNIAFGLFPDSQAQYPFNEWLWVEWWDDAGGEYRQPRLVAYNLALPLLVLCAPVLAELATTPDITPDEFERRLVRLGYEGTTNG